MVLMEDIGKKVDAIALRLKMLHSKSNLSHKDELQRKQYIEEIYKLLSKYARLLNHEMGIADSNYINNEYLWITLRYTIDTYVKSEHPTFFSLFSKNYKMKKPDIIADYIENELNYHDNSNGLLEATRKYLKEIGIKHHVDKRIIDAEIEKRKRPNYELVKKFAEGIGCTKEEIDKLDEIYNTQYALSIDAKNENEDEPNQTYIAAEASLQANNNQDKAEHDTFGLWDDILAITHEQAAQKGPKDVEYMRGYWTIQFIEEQIGKKQAKIWEIYILLLFFMTYEHLYSKHGELMDLMAKQFNLKRRAWHNHYVETFNDICRYIRKMHILKEDSYE